MQSTEPNKICGKLFLHYLDTPQWYFNLLYLLTYFTLSDECEAVPNSCRPSDTHTDSQTTWAESTCYHVHLGLLNKVHKFEIWFVKANSNSLFWYSLFDLWKSLRNMQTVSRTAVLSTLLVHWTCRYHW